MPIIEWDDDGYPTEESLKQLEKALKVFEKGVKCKNIFTNCVYI